MRDIDGVIFDKDGTLFDFAATWGVWTRGMIAEEAKGDAALMQLLADVLGYDLAEERFRKDSVVIAHTTDTVAEALLPLLPGENKPRLVGRMNARAEGAPQVEAVPLAPLLDRLRAGGLKLGVVTNDAEAPARVHLGTAGVLDRFDFIAGFDSGHGAKPAPGQLLAFAAATELDPARIAMVGDSLHDLHAAAAAGMIPVAVLTGVAETAELAPAAEVVLASIADLPDWLAGRGA